MDLNLGAWIVPICVLLCFLILLAQSLLPTVVAHEETECLIWTKLEKSMSSFWIWKPYQYQNNIKKMRYLFFKVPGHNRLQTSGNNISQSKLCVAYRVWLNKNMIHSLCTLLWCAYTDNHQWHRKMLSFVGANSMLAVNNAHILASSVTFFRWPLVPTPLPIVSICEQWLKLTPLGAELNGKNWYFLLDYIIF